MYYLKNKREGAALSMVVILVMVVSIIFIGMSYMFSSNDRAVEVQGQYNELYYYSKLANDIARQALSENNEKLLNDMMDDNIGTYFPGSKVEETYDHTNFPSGVLPNNVKIGFTIDKFEDAAKHNTPYIRVVSRAEFKDSGLKNTLVYKIKYDKNSKTVLEGIYE